MRATPRWTRRNFLATTGAIIAATRLPAQPPEPQLVYVGSSASGRNAGIHTATWNPATGTLSNLRLALQANGADFLAAATIAGKRTLFAARQLPANMGELGSYQIAPNGDLTRISSIKIPDCDFVHTAVDHTGLTLITASYDSGKVFSAKIGPQGQLSGPVSQFQLTGHGPNPYRQISPHAHGVAISPDNRFVLINDLGTDRIMIYKLNAATAALTPNTTPWFQVASGSGPRHTAFHPSGRWAYSINELDSTITQMDWNAANGTLSLVATTPTLPPGGDIATNQPAELAFDESGRFLYASNRAALEEILVYSVSTSGTLTLAQRLAFGGKEARHFALSPDGTFLILAEQFSDKVAIFTRNPTSGTLKLTANQYPLQNPSCILFV